jgi:hypothetical protein
MMAKRLQQMLTNAGAWLSRPWIVGIVLLYVALWLIFDSGSFGWHGVATIATLLMTLFIGDVRWHTVPECGFECSLARS